VRVCAEPPSACLGGWPAQVQTERRCSGSRGNRAPCVCQGTDGPQSDVPGASKSARGSHGS
jgi:hypothetical protein